MPVNIVAKRKLSKDFELQKKCCNKFSAFACVCAVFSLLVHTYNFVGRNDSFELEAKKYLRDVFENEIEDKIEAYISAKNHVARTKREAMLVRYSTFI